MWPRNAASPLQPYTGFEKSLAAAGTFASVSVEESSVIHRMGLGTAISVVVAGCILASAALADDHHVESDRNCDCSKLKTFQLRPGTIDSGRAERNNSLVLEKISDALRSELSCRGLKETTTQPDVIVEFPAAGLDYNIGSGAIPDVIDASRVHGASGERAARPDEAVPAPDNREVEILEGRAHR